MSQRIFITGTDTGVGKTITTLCLAVHLRKQGYRVGIFKPVQCAGDDALFLKKQLKLDDDIRVINPIYAKEPLSPHLALKRSNQRFQLSKVKRALATLDKKYDVVLIEGAGGLMVPLTDKYLTIDLIRDLKAEVVIVSRRGLGAINHSLLTINVLRRALIEIKGIVFCDAFPVTKSVPVMTNPTEICRIGKVTMIGHIPFMKSITVNNIQRLCDLKLSV